MSEMTEYTPGTFSWVDLGTTDGEAAKKFYGNLFGWDLTDFPAGEAGVYTMAQLNGKDVAALYQMGEEQQAQGMPPCWNSYVSVANAAESAEKVKQLGGNVLTEPFDVMDAGRMAMVQDPTGAVFAIWEPKTHIGAKLVNEPGTLTWNELATGDTAKAGEFYAGVFGWGVEVQKMPTGDYTIFNNGDRPNAGMMPMLEEWGDDIPPHWLVYFAVDDCDASVEKAKELGAKIAMPATDIPDVGRFAVVQDPQGAVFSIIKMVAAPD